MLTDNQFEQLLSLRSLIKNVVSSLQDVGEYSEKKFHSLYEDEIYIPQKVLSDSFAYIFKQHPNFKRLQERLQIMLSTKKMQISQKAVQEQRKLNSNQEPSSFVLIPNLMEKLKTDDINQVINSLEQIFEKLDTKKGSKGNNPNLECPNECSCFEKVNYHVFKKFMKNNYGIDTESEQDQEYFKPFINNQYFIYPEFIKKVTFLHLPEGLNNKLIPYYSALNEVANILILTQNQTFHDFKNKLSNLIFNQESCQAFSFTLIEDFFNQYDEQRGNPLKYNVKKISPALLYQCLFLKNEWIGLYNIFKQKEEIDFEVDNKQFSQIYQKEELINNFNSYMDYIYHIFSFLIVTEKISLQSDQSPLQSISQCSNNSPLHSPGGKQRMLMTHSMSSRLKSPKPSQLENLPNSKFLRTKKSNYIKQFSNQSQTSQLQDQNQVEQADSVNTPRSSTAKKSHFSGF